MEARQSISFCFSVRQVAFEATGHFLCQPLTAVLLRYSWGVLVIANRRSLRSIFTDTPITGRFVSISASYGFWVLAIVFHRITSAALFSRQRSSDETSTPNPRQPAVLRVRLRVNRYSRTGLYCFLKSDRNSPPTDHCDQIHENIHLTEEQL